MSYLTSPETIVYIVSDIAAGVFLCVLIFSVMVQSQKHPGLPHLFAAAVIVLAGIIVRFFAVLMADLPAEFTWDSAMDILITRSAAVYWTIAYVLMSIGLSEAAVHTIYVNESVKISSLKPIVLINLITAAAAIMAFSTSADIKAFNVGILAQLLCLVFNNHVNWSRRTSRQFGRASIVVATMFVIALITDYVRLTSIGLALMLITLNEQYHNRVGRELAEKEAALANSKLQLLADQISPHYIYNSLQSIRGLVGTDPDRAGAAIEAFSGYLRGNLESFTKEDLIPFERELEHTRVYLELERTAGQRRFDVEYDLDEINFMLPPLVLQPLVENAVQHGNGGKAEGTIITIATREIDGDVCIEVTDRPAKRPASEGAVGDADVSARAEAGNGNTLNNTNSDLYYEKPQNTAKNRNKQKSIGIDNVRTRLAMQCGGTLKISSFEEGTRVTIWLPKLPKTATKR